MKARPYRLKSYPKVSVFILFLIAFGSQIANAQCPTVTNPTQTFCDVESVLIGDLVATDNGGGIVWYESATSTTPIPNNAGLNNNEDYYAGDTSGSCANRQRVDVIIFGPPSGQNFQGVCLDNPSNATVADLVANGNDVRWYSAPAGGTALSSSAVLMDNSIYYADQANPNSGCRTSRLSVLVNVGSTPVPEGDTTQDFCVTPTSIPTVGDLVASGMNNWYPSLSSALPLALETPLENGRTYYATTVDPPCESTARLAVFVTFTNRPDPGTNGNVDLCENNATVDLFSILGGTPDSGGIWSPTLTSGTGVFDPALDPEGVYTYSLAAEAPCEATSANVTVSLVPQPIAGNDGAITLCSDGETVNLFESLGGNPQPGGTWSPALNSGSGIFNPATDPEGVYTYTVSGTAPCDDVTANVTVSVGILPIAGSSASIEICDNIATIDLFNSLGGNPDVGGTWSPALASGSGVFDPSIDAEGTYTYTVLGTAPCPNASATVTLTITEFPDAGTNGAIELCSDDATVNLFNSLGGTPEAGGTWSPALSSGTGLFDPSVDAQGNYTYTLAGTAPCPNATAVVSVSVIVAPNPGENASVEICGDNETIDLFNSLGSSADTGGTWSPSLNSGTGIFDPSIDAEGTYTYTLLGTAPCSDASANVTVTIVPFLDAGLNGNITLCTNDAPVNLFNSLNGTPQNGGTWSPSLNSGSGLFNPSIDAEGTYTYTQTGTASCPDASAQVTVSLEVVPDAGQNGSLQLCGDSAVVNLFDSLGGTPDGGGTWSPALSSGTGFFDPNVDAEGVYTYTQLSPTALCDDDIATVTVSISEESDAGENASVTICTNTGAMDLFNSLGGTPQAGGTWSPTLNSGSGLFDPALDAEGVYTYTITGISPCPDDSATVNVSIETVPDAGLDGSLQLCSDNAPVNLFDSLGGTPEAGGTWTPTLTSGTGVFDPNSDTQGSYTYTISSVSGACPDNSAIVTVTVTEAADAGLDAAIDLCSNVTSVDLFNSLGGTPEPGGVWSPTLASGAGIFNPNLDPAGTYTYTIIGTAPCSEVSANVTVSIQPLPNAGNDLTLDVCRDGVPVDLFEELEAAEPGGIWTPALDSGTGVFDPLVDTAGTYTYTVTSSSCLLSDEASVVVILKDSPDVTGAILATDLNLCLGSSAVAIVIGATQLADGVYTIVYQLTGANTATNVVNITVEGGNSTFTIADANFENAGLTTVTVTGFFFAGENCTGDVSLIDAISVNIQDPETPQLIAGGATFCSEDNPNPTIADLTGNIVQSGSILWYDLPENGTAYTMTDALVDGQTYYATLVTANGCESSVRLEVTVSSSTCIKELTIPDGFSPNGDGINDDFHIVNLETLFPNFKLSVFNRYGNILYEGNSSSQRWDGTSRKGDSILPVGVYFYILEFNDGERSPQQGRVYLSR
ncbi:gliding motility-associated C-terminal domain-containing protein [Subsaximicrobium wynnwilliamsii]|uniref:Gliding motility-associated C-terminal domain-containing protein n=1 Tax=Subsaximicrobium wynnwilliamsii TaxID=291179 RepID=A0A5C6ZFX7_9FLAO|nr:gliding motility-associated C-terminal domain-containing protein [Subsaximicrobium wynnwilliamsii]TXD82804.1 gliding motility-associated C-terminal domain-containing protein [Subsaximicrobium wynnwilliamsii]TXD88528.1 gliding motility-associated C-terminal domain-containing protein [Subsaximicrobium wynnwilliamsii]TXE02476.1 gliding motility-associated C-terminal domain-containing protein [Subsaximicrobium wynnwilliamsii]